MQNVSPSAVGWSSDAWTLLGTQTHYGAVVWSQNVKNCLEYVPTSNYEREGIMAQSRSVFWVIDLNTFFASNLVLSAARGL